MEEQSIDQQKLPGVKEVCRDFAVLEDHSLAHNLQEQEIEHHLASNIQRTRLVQHDLVVAKQLQEQEDLRAHARLKKRHKDLERQDCEIAQEIQEKLVIEADRRQRQEAKDEDIARLLQEKERKEEKKRKKHLLDPPVIEDGSFHLAAAHSRCSPEEHRSDHDRPRQPRSGESHGRSKDETKHSEAKVYSEVHEHGLDVSDRSRRHSDDPAERDDRRHRDRDRLPPRRERPERPPAPNLNRDPDVNHRLKELERFDDHVLVRDRCTLEERSPARILRDAKYHDLKEPNEKSHKRGDLLEPKRTGHRARSPSPYKGRDTDHREESGMRVRGTRDMVHSKPRTEVKELDDAAIARRLQEEERRASQEDERAAQVAQDEEIARLFMEQEKKARRKLKSCEKASLEKRRPEEWSIEVNELGHPRSRDHHEHHRPRSDKPSRPPPPSSEVIAESEYSRNFDKQPSSTRPFSKSESSPKGSYYRQ